MRFTLETTGCTLSVWEALTLCVELRTSDDLPRRFTIVNALRRWEIAMYQRDVMFDKR